MARTRKPRQQLSRRRLVRLTAAGGGAAGMAAFLAACAGTTTEVIKEVPVEVIKEVQVAGETIIKEVPVEVVVPIEVIKEIETIVEVPGETTTIEKIVEVMPDNPKADLLVFGNRTTGRTTEFDMRQVFELQTMMISQNVSEALVLWNYNERKFEPRLAVSWEVAEDAKSITFKLREGVKFHNGDDFTAEDVKWSFDSAFLEDHPDNEGGEWIYTSFVPFYEGTEIIDDHTVRVEFSQSDALILGRFTVWSTHIAHKASVQEFGLREYSLDPDATAFVGTGPYFPVEHRQNELVRLQRFDDWWGATPDFEEIVFQNFSDDDARTNALLAGELDVAAYMPSKRRNDLAVAPGILSKFFPQWILGYFYINHSFPLFSDKLVRQAIARSLDRKTFYENTAGPTTLPMNYFWYPGSPFTNEDVDLSYNPEEVARLMEEAGFAKGGDGVWAKPDGTRAEFKLQYSGSPGEPPPELEQFWQQALNDQGFEVVLEPWDPGLRQDHDEGHLAEKNLNLGGFGVGTILGDPDFALNRWTTDYSFNLSYYSSVEMDQLYLDQQTEGDPEKRIAIHKRMQELAAEDIPWIPTSANTLGMAWWDDKVTNVTAGALQYTYPWLYKAASS